MSNTDNLTPREMEVLQLVSQGLRDSEIAEALVIEISTVKTHLFRLFGKMLVHTRTGLVVQAMAKGLIDCACIDSKSHATQPQLGERHAK